ncbi:triose-phosphate isomerase [[Mycoplasma] mobile]|uniref:Triosephosphate isomerase n=1 Tax=Mycoplasma mobile (strain ATCC 43663 / 163K / NCTC 11711) TaxID=267748 RepID=TPIS_MYCM1|nr:triose-phosphate isomerase [[Mycoplasma] mobile]Q6KHM5.1 RecName: Full=Triosephosphate isomerase; Short=TIM; Short=TPI; AltName: Full=Triose-phosphate isomerase [Mycoplasma mobile 163K]AAT27905.1 triosephosphate isomerase [Mycoplasma mobile 163K]
MRKKIIIGNWKMNKTKTEAENFVKEFNKITSELNLKLDKNLVAGLALPFTSLGIKKEGNFANLVIAAQNFHQNNSGAFTGEISAEMLLDLGVKMVVLGHSERREFFHETDEIVNMKMHQAIKNNLVPIVCVGETELQYNSNKSKEVIKNQIEKSLKNLSDFSKIIIAYEPIWAIGTGKTATVEYAQEMCKYIRSLTNEKTIIQYGGSVKPNNIKELLSQKDIDGALVGGASLNVKDFIDLIK